MSPSSAPPETNAGEPTWERETMRQLLFASLDEQRQARRWGVFFKSAFLAYLLLLLGLYVPWKSFYPSAAQHSALIDVRGVIADDSEASADRIVTGLRAAFEDKRTAGIILRINSPGGSPVQAGYVYDEIRRLRSEHADTKVYAVISDICASGGYYIAAAADEIYADKSSLVGSIGVLMNGFGFVGAMDKMGIERRLITAGEHKGLMDPFSPLKADEIRHIRSVMNEMHAQFIDVVKKGRADRLSADPSLFTGLIWTGKRSIELGLVDALGNSSYVAREIIGAEEIVDFTSQRSMIDRFAERLGGMMVGLMARQPDLSKLFDAQDIPTFR